MTTEPERRDFDDRTEWHPFHLSDKYVRQFHADQGRWWVVSNHGRTDVAYDSYEEAVEAAGLVPRSARTPADSTRDERTITD